MRLVLGMLLVSSCRTALGVLDSQDLQRVSVVTEDEELRRRLQGVAPSIVSDVSRLLGAPAGDVTIRVDTELEGVLGITRHRVVVDRGGQRIRESEIFLAELDPATVAGTIGHEAVHYLVHMGPAHLRSIPPVLEEALATYVSLELNGTKELAFHGAPSDRLIDRALRFGLDEYQALPPSEGLGLRGTGMWIIALVGHRRLLELSMEADDGGRIEPHALRPYLVDPPHAFVVATDWGLGARATSDVPRMTLDFIPAAGD